MEQASDPLKDTGTNVLFYPEAARVLRRNPLTLRKDVMLGKIPHHKPFGKKGRVVFFRDELDAFLRGESLNQGGRN